MASIVISAKNIPAGKMTTLENNGKEILVANVDGKYYAIDNDCTHLGCKLNEGTLTGVRVECPCHGSTFDVTTGAVVTGPTTSPEPIYPATVSGDQILIAV
jgi:nitrite reductase/ring-hydroxylating ferredoxin subunit